MKDNCLVIKSFIFSEKISCEKINLENQNQKYASKNKHEPVHKKSAIDMSSLFKINTNEENVFGSAG